MDSHGWVMISYRILRPGFHKCKTGVNIIQIKPSVHGPLCISTEQMLFCLRQKVLKTHKWTNFQNSNLYALMKKSKNAVFLCRQRKWKSHLEEAISLSCSGFHPLLQGRACTKKVFWAHFSEYFGYLKGQFTIFSSFEKSYILVYDGVQYSSFWSEGSGNHLN